MPLPLLKGTVAVIGYTAVGINGAKPTPVNAAMPGVAVLAEATEALITGNAIAMSPTWLKTDYVGRHGAAVLMSSLDRNAEYRADQAAGIYLARAGFDPLAFYAVLQKMTALGTCSARMSQMYRTHPPLDHRLDRLDRQAPR